MGLFDLFRKKDQALDPSLLHRIDDLGTKNDLRVIVELLPFLPPPTSAYGPAAARAVHANVDAATPEEVAYFDQWYRERTCSGPPRPSWEDMRIGPLEDWVREHLSTVAIATCHHSGFVREKAVAALEEEHDGRELPFLLVRLNDWVPAVRFVAARAVRARLIVSYAPHWVRCLGLLERIRLGGRSDHEWLRHPVLSLLQRDESRGALEAGLASGSLGVRRACVRVAAGHAESTSLLRLALQDSDPVTSRSAAEMLCKSLDGDPLREVLAILRVGNARARCLAIETLCDRFPGEAEPDLRAALLDSATSVRELARFKSQKLGSATLDFPKFYRDQLDVHEGELLITSLRGLAETGTVVDVPIFLKYVGHARARVREAAVLGIGRCDGQNHVELLTKALGDSNLRVAKAAHRYARLYLGRGAVSKRPQRPTK